MIYEAKHHNGKHWWGSLVKQYLRSSAVWRQGVAVLLGGFFLCKLFDKIHSWKNTHFNIQLLPFLRQNLSSYCVCYVFHEAKAESTSTLPFTRFPWVSWHEKFLSVWFSFVIPILRLVITWSCKTFKHQSFQMMGHLWYKSFPFNRFSLSTSTRETEGVQLLRISCIRWQAPLKAFLKFELITRQRPSHVLSCWYDSDQSPFPPNEIQNAK